MEGLWPVGQNTVSPTPDNNGAALLRDLFDQLAGQARELAVFETQRRRDVIGALKTADAKGFDEAFDKRAHTFIFGLNIILRDMLLGRDGTDNFLVPDFPDLRRWPRSRAIRLPPLPYW